MESLSEWIRERCENAKRIADTKAGDERLGWLEDASYLRRCHEALEVCDEILRIMKIYHEQDARPAGVDTPGGLEHMGDVWRLFKRWEGMLQGSEG